jgi:hypothetical protein
MATRIWTGAISGDWGVAGNWDTLVPVNGDDAVFSSGAVSVTAGLNQAAVALASLTITDEYTGAIGTSAGSLLIDATTMTLSGKSTTTGYYFDGTYTTVNLLEGSTVTAAEGVELDGTITLVRAYGGKLAIATGAAVTTIDTKGGSANGLQITIAASVTALTDIRHVGGTFNLGSACTNYHMKSGTANITEGALTLIEIDSGTLTHTSNDNIGTVRQFGGTVDLSDNVMPGLAITTYEGWNGSLKINNGLGGPAISTLRRHGTSFKVTRDAGAAV